MAITGLVLMAAILLIGCSNNPPTGGPTAKTNITTAEVAEETRKLLGQAVTVRSEIAEKIGPSTFTLLFEDQPILVVNATEQVEVLPTDNTEVQVTGEVSRFIRVEVERDYNLDLPPELYAAYEGKPAIIASSIALAPEPAQVVENPDRFYGKALAIRGEVEKLGTAATSFAKVFKLNEGDLLVINRKSQVELEDGDEVVATGVLRQFVLAEVRESNNLGAEDLEALGQQRVDNQPYPVLIATNIYPLPSALETAK